MGVSCGPPSNFKPWENCATQEKSKFSTAITETLCGVCSKGPGLYKCRPVAVGLKSKLALNSRKSGSVRARVQVRPGDGYVCGVLQ